MSSLLTHPYLRGISLGSHEWFRAQRRMIRHKPAVQRCYDLWYRLLLADADSATDGSRPQRLLELGSGSSYLKELRPSLITSDIVSGVADTVIDGRRLPFRDSSLGGILMTHVLHHIPDVESFFREAERVLVPGGVISMVECTHTPFARFFFSAIHPEPYEDGAKSWSFPPGDTMLDSNQALSWLVFHRDRARFEHLFPGLKIEVTRYLPWFSYLMSGGVNLRSLVPRFLAGAASFCDRVLKPLDPLFAIHWHIRVRKVSR